VLTDTNLSVCIYFIAFTEEHTHTHTHIHTYIHTYIHTFIQYVTRVFTCRSCVLVDGTVSRGQLSIWPKDKVIVLNVNCRHIFSPNIQMLVTVTFITIIIIIMYFNVYFWACCPVYLHYWYLSLFSGAGHVSFLTVVQSHKNAVADCEDTGISIDNRTQTQFKLNGLTFPDVM